MTVRLASALCVLALAALVAPAVAGPPVVLSFVTGYENGGRPVVWAAAADGSGSRQLGPGSDPVVSPDGSRIAASLFGVQAGGEPRGPMLAVYSTTGAPAQRFFGNDRAVATVTAKPLAWSLDSRYLAVALTGTDLAGHGTGLAVLDTLGARTQVLARGAVSGASFDPRSDQLVWAQTRRLTQSFGAAVDIYRAAADGSGRRMLTHDGRSLQPLWGPHGIAYTRERLRHADAPVYQLWLMRPDGRRLRRLTNMRIPKLVSGLVPTFWSADGTRLLAEYEGQDTSEAWTLVIRTGRLRRLAVGHQPVVGAGLSRDGRVVLAWEGFLGDPSGTIATLPFTGGPAVARVARASQPAWNG